MVTDLPGECPIAMKSSADRHLFRDLLASTAMVARLGRVLSALTLAVSLAIPGPQSAWANPEGATVKSGSVSISESGTRLDIHQSTNKAIIDWRRFSIDAGEITEFHQPSSGSITLNRVTGADPSNIFGALRANGQIMLINPNGILFGPGSRIDVSGLVATTANIRDEDFLNGVYDFTQASPNPDASVVNEGEITIAEAGYAALVAPAVRNSGLISARLGRVTLGGAAAFTLDLYGDNLVTFRTGVSETPQDAGGQAVDSLVRNNGQILADGGRVVLAADNIGAVVQNVINMDGVIQANSIAQENGEVVITASGPGTVSVSGAITAQGNDAGETGGTVKVLGERVGLFDGTRIDASGDAGGGEVLVGGNFQGSGPERNARQTGVAADAVIAADAWSEGDGGRIIIWADENTQYYGTISATGGTNGGNGGFAEISGKQNLAFNGAVDLTAEAGEAGTLLLDPTDILISADNTDGDNGGTIGLFDFPAGEPWNVSPAALDAVGGSISLVAINDITFATALTLNTAGASLTAQAANAIIVNANITTTNADIFLTAGTGAVTMAGGTVIDSGSGRIEITSTTAGLTLETLTSTSTATASGTEAIRLAAGGGGGFTFNNTISATGNIVVQGSAASTALSVGGAGLGNLMAGDTLIIGRSDGTSTLTVLTTTLNSATTFLNDANIDIQGTVTNSVAGGLTKLDAGSGRVLFTGGGGTRITSNGGDITLLSDLELDGGAYTITSNNGDISLSAITDNSGTGSDLTADAGTGAYSHTDADLDAAAGVLTATGATVDIGSSLIADTAILNGDATGSGLAVRSLTITGSGATLFGTVNGKSDDFAAAEANMPDADTHTINGCWVSACPVTEPDTSALDTVIVPSSTTDPVSVDTGDTVISVESDIGGDTATTDVSSESGGDTGGTFETGDWVTGSFDPVSSDPVMSPSFSLSLGDFMLRLEDAELDDAELLERAEGNEDPELASLTQDLLLLLGEYEILLSDAVPTDAFDGVATVIVPGLVRFEPNGGEETEDVFLAYQPSGFALYQY